MDVSLLYYITDTIFLIWIIILLFKLTQKIDTKIDTVFLDIATYNKSLAELININDKLVRSLEDILERSNDIIKIQKEVAKEQHKLIEAQLTILKEQKEMIQENKEK